MKQTKKLLLFFLGLFIAMFPVDAQSGRIEFSEFTLDNGLHVILHQDNATPIVTVAVMYDVGSKHERPDRTGFAHFFEHLMFEGTKHIPRGEYARFVEMAGGTLNANTSADRTYYFQTLPSNQLELGLWLESERMLHASVDSVGIQTQKQVVIEERKQMYDNRPYGTILIETMARAFTKHPYQWTTIGDPEHIMAAEDHEFQEFYDMFYVPNNAVLVIAGDIVKEDTRTLIEKYFGDIPTRTEEIYRPNIIEPPLKAEVRDTIFDNVQIPLVLQAYRTPALNTEDYFAIDMLGTLLSTGQSSRFFRELVDNQELALQVGTFPLPYNEPTVTLTYAFANMGIEPHVLEEAMNIEIEKVRNELIPEEEFQKLRNQFENDIIGGNSRIAERAHNLATYHTYFGDASLINKELEKYMAVTREDIQRVAREYFRSDNRVVLYYLPKR
ncbi:M16 family metallopeptidase [Natronoflexus pectinivorans]|uniref:Putative Zn-dependent peptidase n=1 Tax=Natronoflexus pectinivorans TaxID=682526 RepID=A0A4R2GJF5_9BACT|nr:pitrilysin family protein [Natronoflexus pectinivorans]TCO08453.1 putative Zn-dependent peptidase [Natronoflexus pectinivorans]